MAGTGSVDSVGSPNGCTVAQQRVVHAAIDLFARHGVGGTSLQMIADALGVTKAAVYHQFRSKQDIVLAAATTELARLEAVVAAAEAQSSRRRAREEAISGIVELAVATRRRVGTLLADPVIVTHFANHEGFRRVMLRLQRVLTGDDKRPADRLRTAMLVAAISGAATHPLVTDVDDATLRRELRHMARRFLERVAP